MSGFLLVEVLCDVSMVVVCALLYMDGVVLEVNAGVLGRWLELVAANSLRYEINRL